MNEYNDWVYKLASFSKYFGLFLAFGLGFSIIYTQTKPPSAPNTSAVVKIITAPSNVIIKLDGKIVKDGDFTVQPGEHSVEISKEGFITQNITKDVANKSTVFMGAALNPNSTDAAIWYKDRPNESLLAEGVSGAEASVVSSDVTNSTPIVTKLPIDGLVYKINYGAAAKGVSGSSPTIYISADNYSDRLSAMHWIKYNGYDPSTMNILFLGTVNPFLKINNGGNYDNG